MILGRLIYFAPWYPTVDTNCGKDATDLGEAFFSMYVSSIDEKISPHRAERQSHVGNWSIGLCIHCLLWGVDVSSGVPDKQVLDCGTAGHWEDGAAVFLLGKSSSAPHSFRWSSSSPPELPGKLFFHQVSWMQMFVTVQYRLHPQQCLD